MNTPKLIITPRRPAVLADFPATVDVLVRVQAPDLPAGVQATRTPLHLALVIDRSGSMAGQPLAEARRAAAFVIDGLAPQDRASLVVYDDSVDTLVPLTGLADKSVLRKAIAAIDSAGSTDLHGGWFGGAETLAPATAAGIISRVILLSDGCANHGLTEPEAIFAQCRELAAAGVTTSTYGLGRGFNEDLMIGMARAGQGNTYYGQTAEDLMDPFREELALLNALCARRLILEVQTAEGVRAEVLNGYTAVGDGSWQLPDLAYGGEAWALVRLTVPRRSASADPAMLMTAGVRYVDLSGEPRALQPETLTLPAVAAGAYDALLEDELVARRAGELEAARLQREARAAARRHDWATVDLLVAKTRVLGEANPWLGDIAAGMAVLADGRDEVMFAKEAAYSSDRMSNRLAPSRESRDRSAPAPAFLRRKSAQGKAEPDATDRK
ncbi:MAG: VWA domain-containing protein [Gammaproteobacteria bacterium]|nr:VWA domain-containing protein [Gammaproteobacteria bacterium]